MFLPSSVSATTISPSCSMSLRSVRGSAVIPCSFKWADMSASEIGCASSVVSQRYLNMRSVRLVSIRSSHSFKYIMSDSFIVLQIFYGKDCISFSHFSIVPTRLLIICLASVCFVSFSRIYNSSNNL